MTETFHQQQHFLIVKDLRPTKSIQIDHSSKSSLAHHNASCFARMRGFPNDQGPKQTKRALDVWCQREASSLLGFQHKGFATSRVENRHEKTGNSGKRGYLPFGTRKHIPPFTGSLEFGKSCSEEFMLVPRRVTFGTFFLFLKQP